MHETRQNAVQIGMALITLLRVLGDWDPGGGDLGPRKRDEDLEG